MSRKGKGTKMAFAAIVDPAIITNPAERARLEREREQLEGIEQDLSRPWVERANATSRLTEIRRILMADERARGQAATEQEQAERKTLNPGAQAGNCGKGGSATAVAALTAKVKAMQAQVAKLQERAAKLQAQATNAGLAVNATKSTAPSHLAPVPYWN
jgi:hypothetical protein